MTRPVRLQLSRAKGFRLQEHSRSVNGLEAVNVARPSKWGNPFIVGHPSGYDFKDGGDPTPMVEALTLAQCVTFYRELVTGCIKPEMHPWGHRWFEKFKRQTGKWSHPAEELRRFHGCNLACWCPLDAEHCHADVLLELSQSRGTETMTRTPPAKATRGSVVIPLRTVMNDVRRDVTAIAEGAEYIVSDIERHHDTTYYRILGDDDQGYTLHQSLFRVVGSSRP